MKKSIFGAAIACALTPAVFAEGISIDYMVSGTEVTKAYVVSSQVDVKGSVTHSKQTPGTYTLKNGIYRMSDGSCHQYKSELIEMRKFGDIELPDIKRSEEKVACPVSS
jgi:hypothetical protein